MKKCIFLLLLTQIYFVSTHTCELPKKLQELCAKDKSDDKFHCRGLEALFICAQKKGPAANAYCKLVYIDDRPIASHVAWHIKFLGEHGYNWSPNEIVNLTQETLDALDQCSTEVNPLLKKFLDTMFP